eukprot:CAMPEP_0171080746 /NCGR_PEP_ID=MMETSP0766_2-20121228/16055_1 /TAXON_ID=439317 /ORGANISM="Gambierdiscus australes, Strain CAWD 149" /LENGTH=589 /DNA_ID=CAMNT_0011538015 /DNA_START=35 /DNA_END=1804 /DNA_ORIENTATION=+
MAEPPAKAARTDMPEITIGMLSGAVVWGPRKVNAGATASELAAELPRPMGCPGLELLHDTTLLAADADVSELPDGARLTVNFHPPKPFDHSFVTELLALPGISEEEMVLPGSRLNPSTVTVEGAEVLRVSFQSIEQVKLLLRVPEGSELLVEGDKHISHATAQWSGTDKTYAIGGIVVKEEPPEQGGTLVEATTQMDSDFIYELGSDVEWSPVQGLIEKHFMKRVFEGVSCNFNVTKPSIDRLNKLIDELKENEPADYHPDEDSSNIVRDLVHPHLFPFVKGESQVEPDLPPEEAQVVRAAQEPARAKKDMWNRPYEESKYQWLPAEVSVSSLGKCEFLTYINNLPREKYGELYGALGELLSQALPHLEDAWSHGSAVEFLEDDEDVYDIGSDAEDGEVPLKSLRGRTLQIIVKIVDYELKAGQVHEGVWHVEGMSHENIVATAELVLQKGPSLQGGELQYQRAWTKVEAGRFGGLPQCRPEVLENCIKDGLCPLGRLPLEQGQLTVWPNSHVHKLTQLKNTSDAPEQRRIVVFWLVNPDKRIISTRHVPEQRSSMSLEKAKEHRLELMKERKRHKEDWNVREVSLCEH